MGASLVGLAQRVTSGTTAYSATPTMLTQIVSPSNLEGHGDKAGSRPGTGKVVPLPFTMPQSGAGQM